MEDLNSNKETTEDIDNMNNDGENYKKGTKRGRIFIRNLPFTATETSITKLFSDIGSVSDVSIFIPLLIHQIIHFIGKSSY